MPKCDFNKVALLFLRTPLAGCFCTLKKRSEQDTISYAKQRNYCLSLLR